MTQPPRRSLGLRLALLCAALLAPAAPALASDLEIDWGGSVESDLRFEVPTKGEGTAFGKLRFERSENTLRFATKLRYDMVRAVADIKLVFTGQSEAANFEDLTRRTKVDPFRIESDAAYLELWDIAPGIDLRLGRQVLQWGTADQFNPTSNLNPLDLEDPLMFGERIANEMIVLKMTAPWTVELEDDDTAIFDELNLTLAAVPIFKGSQLPRSGLVAFTQPDVFSQVVDSPLLENFVVLQKAFLDRGGDIGYDVRVEDPDITFDNVQFGARLGWTLYGIDMSLSYYRGFDKNPRAERIDVDSPVSIRDPYDLTDMLETLEIFDDVSALSIGTEVRLTYPRVHVFGADLATSLDFLGGTGIWVEWSMTMHDDLFRLVQIGQNAFLERERGAGAFHKVAAGFDNSLTSWWYINVQYLHGFVDEFGESALRDYLVAGMDFKMADEQLILRIFGILQFQDLSAVIYPNFFFHFWQNTELSLGALLYFGASDSKFGSALTGSSTVFFKGKYSF